MKRKLEKEWYDILKNLDYSLRKVEVSFDDKNCIFDTKDENFDVIFDLNIVAYGMDKEQNECTEYGRKLYALYDLIFFSNYGAIEEEEN